MSCTDYGNAILYGLSKKQLWKLHMYSLKFYIAAHYWNLQIRSNNTSFVQSTSAVCSSGNQIQAFVYGAVHHLGPVYLSSVVTPYTLIQTLRSANQGPLTISWYHFKCCGRWASSLAGMTQWNNPPPAIRKAKSVAAFKTLLKT